MYITKQFINTAIVLPMYLLLCPIKAALYNDVKEMDMENDLCYTIYTKRVDTILSSTKYTVIKNSAGC